MTMEGKLVISELEQGKELANKLMINLKQHTSSIDSNKLLISEILRVYQNAIFMLNFNEDKNKNKLKRKSETNDKGSKKRKITTLEKVKVFVGKEHDDGYSWRKYGQKEIHGSINPRGYFRCTHRFTQDCVAVKQVQRSDTDASVYEVMYLGNHTCNNINTSPTTTNFSISMVQQEDIKPAKIEEVIITKPEKTEEEVIISLDDLENKNDIFRTFSFSNYEFENGNEWKNDIFPGKFSPASTSGSGITNEIGVAGPSYVENSETADSYFSNLDNIVEYGQDWLWSAIM